MIKTKITWKKSHQEVTASVQMVISSVISFHYALEMDKTHAVNQVFQTDPYCEGYSQKLEQHPENLPRQYPAPLHQP